MGSGASSSGGSPSSFFFFFAAPFSFFAAGFLSASKSSTHLGRSSIAGVYSRQSLTWSTASALSRGIVIAASGWSSPASPALSSATKSFARTSAHSSGIRSTSRAPDVSRASNARHRSAAAASKSGGGSCAAATAGFPPAPFSAAAAARRALRFDASSADARTAHASRNPSAGAPRGASPTSSIKDFDEAPFAPLFPPLGGFHSGSAS